MRAAIYVRISADIAGDGHGVSQQHAECLQLIGREGWVVGETFSDNDISAYSGKRRPGYEALLAHLEGGTADALVAWHPDRLHRSLSDLERFIDVCQRNNIRIETVRGGSMDLSTASGQMIAGMLAVAARHEVGHMIERQKSSQSQRAAEGKFRGGRRRFGFTGDGMSLVEAEAEAIRWGASQLLAGASVGSLVREWTERGLTGAGGRPWSTTTVRRTLQRPALAGLVDHHGEIVGKGQWPAILDEEDWRGVVGILADPTRKPQVAFERRWQGSGVYLCGKCGAPMIIGSRPSRGKDLPSPKVYRCKRTAHLARAAEPVDALVSASVLAWLAESDLKRLLVTQDAGIDVPGLRVRRDSLRSQLNELADAFAEGEIDRQQLRVGTAKLTKKIDGVEEQLASARGHSPLLDLALADKADIPGRWESMSADIRGKIIRELLLVTVMPIEVGSRNKPFDPRMIRVERRL